MLFNLILAGTTGLLCFFFFCLVTFNHFFIIPVVKENTRVKEALVNPAGIPTTFAKEIILIQKQLKSCQYNQRQQCIYLVFYSLFFLLGFQN